MFLWTEESIRFYEQAAIFSRFHECIAKEISEFITDEDHVVDLGCGLGFLSLQLSKLCRNVTAVDCDQNVLEALKVNMLENDIRNIQIQHSDWHKIRKIPKWDIVVASFFGRSQEDMDSFLRLCRKKVIFIFPNGESEGFLPKKNEYTKRETVKETEVSLRAKYKISYYKELELEFGQPFHTMEEAFRFVRNYRKDAGKSVIRKHLEQYLIPVENQKFSYYLPNKKQIAICVLEK